MWWVSKMTSTTNIHHVQVQNEQEVRAKWWMWWMLAKPLSGVDSTSHDRAVDESWGSSNTHHIHHVHATCSRKTSSRWWMLSVPTFTT